MGMDSAVKSAMLKSSQKMTLPKPSSSSPPLTPSSKVLRRVHSTDSLVSPSPKRNIDYDLPPPRAPFMGEDLSASSSGSGSGSRPGSPRKASNHIRGLSFDGPAWKSRSQLQLPLLGNGSMLDLSSKGGKEKEKSSSGSGFKTANAASASASKFVSTLSGTSSTQIDIESIKKLRLMLRNEPAR
jgi:hypothetical protein